MFAALMVRKKLLHEANCPGKSFHAREASWKPFSFNPSLQRKQSKRKKINEYKVQNEKRKVKTKQLQNKKKKKENKK